MLKILSSQKKIIFVASGALAVFLFFLIFIDLPRRRALGSMKSELAILDEQIRQIEALMGVSKDMTQAAALLKAQYQALEQKFPSKEEESFKMLAQTARECNVEVLSLSPQPKTAVLNENQENLEVDGKLCQKVSVSVELKSSFKDFVRYLEKLKALPFFIVAERLRIEKDQPDGSRLNASLEISLYLLA